MGTEIERKFLVKDDRWRSQATAASDFRQGYLAGSEDALSVRVRIADGSMAWLTVKSASGGVERSEFEYEIPLADGEDLLALCGANVIKKRRHTVPWGGGSWMVDAFSGRHDGLVLAEIELPDASQPIDLPPWIGTEVTDDPRYANASLASPVHLE